MDVEASFIRGMPLVLLFLALSSVFWQISKAGFPEVFPGDG